MTTDWHGLRPLAHLGFRGYDGSSFIVLRRLRVARADDLRLLLLFNKTRPWGRGIHVLESVSLDERETSTG